MAKISPKSLGYFFYKKNSPNTIKNCPNGEISPNLVTLERSSWQEGGRNSSIHLVLLHLPSLPEGVPDITVVDPADDDVEEVDSAGEVQTLLGPLDYVPKRSRAETYF
jgi:hypothetical protein